MSTDGDGIVIGRLHRWMAVHGNGRKLNPCKSKKQIESETETLKKEKDAKVLDSVPNGDV